MLENMIGYLFLDIICSSKLTVFLELRSSQWRRGDFVIYNVYRVEKILYGLV